MTYRKPELSILGNAAVLIQGSKNGGKDSANDTRLGALDWEIDC